MIDSVISECSKQQLLYLASEVKNIITKTIPKIAEPYGVVTSKRGRPLNHGKANKKIKSQFEHVDVQIKHNICSNCLKRGHNCRTCLNKTNKYCFNCITGILKKSIVF